MIKNDTNKFHWTRVGIHHRAEYGNTQKNNCHEADRLIYKRRGGPFSNRAKIITIIVIIQEKIGKEQKNREKGLLASAVANEISSVDQSEIMIQGMAS